MIKFRVGALAAAAGLALSACAGIHPGEAVVVGGTSISMNKLDDLSKSFCAYNVALGSQQAQQQGTPPQAVAGGTARQMAAKVLLDLTVAKRVADDLGVSVPPSQYVLTDKQKSQLSEQLGKSTAARIGEVLEKGQRLQLLESAIGAKKLGVDPASADPKKTRDAGVKAVQKAVADSDVSVDPRLGLKDDATPAKVTSGSLSVGVSSLADAKVSDYAVSQRCS